MPDATLNTLWIGGGLGPVERACLRSALRQGHRVRLWTYDAVEGVPEGVEVADAREIIPAERIIRHSSGSYALFSDHFRFALQRAGLGYWIDTDLYLVRPIEREESYVYGWEASKKPGRPPKTIGSAILRIDAASPLLDEILEAFEGRTVPRWASKEDRRLAERRLQETGRVDLGELSWGIVGPHALTWLARERSLTCYADTPEVFYPVSWAGADWIRDPAVSIDDVITPRTLAVHLWNEKIKDYKNVPAPAGSFLARLQDEATLAPPRAKARSARG
jgi:hypothetical protein